MAGTAKFQVNYGLPTLGAAQEVATGAASAASTAFGASTCAVLLACTQDCRVLFGTAPTALSTSTLLPAGVPLVIRVEKGQSWKVAAIQEAVAGKLSVTELPE